MINEEDRDGSHELVTVEGSRRILKQRWSVEEREGFFGTWGCEAEFEARLCSRVWWNSVRMR